ncbi:MAG: hypothetical protein JST27_10820 [Bacteroidetes bacterium]|nr:hypothetical protein [Bacteroidota bacterium]
MMRDISEEVSIQYVPIMPQQAWPWPWKADSFFDAMPECVAMEPAPVLPIPPEIRQAEYDLVLLGWQPWFLHPSQPVTAFLKSEDAKMLAGKPVVTVVGCRNMWLHAGEKVKELLAQCSARQVGNIVLTDTNPNLVSLLTIIRWAFSGKKEKSRWLPEAGVQARDLAATSRFGQALLEATQQPEKQVGLHERLLADGAVQLNIGLVLLEQRGIKNFRFWSRFIREKGAAGAPERQGRVRMFKRLLITAIFILSPLSSLTAFIQERMQRKRLLRDVDYFKGLDYEPGRI